jgi:hypothetical protein
MHKEVRSATGLREIQGSYTVPLDKTHTPKPSCISIILYPPLLLSEETSTPIQNNRLTQYYKEVGIVAVSKEVQGKYTISLEIHRVRSSFLHLYKTSRDACGCREYLPL